MISTHFYPGSHIPYELCTNVRHLDKSQSIQFMEFPCNETATVLSTGFENAVLRYYSIMILSMVFTLVMLQCSCNFLVVVLTEGMLSLPDTLRVVELAISKSQRFILVHDIAR